MDFANVDLRSSADKEFWLQLRIGETPLFLDDDVDDPQKPCRIKVASPVSAPVEEALKHLKRIGEREQSLSGRLAVANREERRSLESQLDAAEKEAATSVEAFLTTAIKGWENIQVNGEVIPFSASALSEMSKPKAPFARMAIYISKDMAQLADPFTVPDSAS